MLRWCEVEPAGGRAQPWPGRPRWLSGRAPPPASVRAAARLPG